MSPELARRIIWRIMPLLGLGMIISILDRVNLSFAALAMNADLGLSATAYGLGVGVFYIGYVLFEVPSNVLLVRIGPRRWLARIMVSWGLLSMAMAMVEGPYSFYAVRFLLGLAEAGFFPGVLYYLHQWFPKAHIGKALAIFVMANPVANAIGAPLSFALVESVGWRWMFALEGMPALFLGVIILFLLPNGPDDAAWLSGEEKQAVGDALAAERTDDPHQPIWAALKERQSVMLAIQYFLILTPSYTIMMWMPLIAKDLGIQMSSIGWFVSLPYAVGVVVLLLFSWLWTAKIRPRWYIFLPLLASALAFAVGAVADDALLALICFCIVMGGSTIAVTAFWALPRPNNSGGGAAAAFALANAVGNAGGFIGPVATGLARDNLGGFTAALFAAAVILLCAGLMAFITDLAPPAAKGAAPPT